MQIERFIKEPQPKQLVKVYNKIDKSYDTPDTHWFGAVIETRFVPTTHIIGGAMVQKVLLRELKYIKFDIEDVDFFFLRSKVIKQ